MPTGNRRPILILERALALLALSLTSMAKAKKPIARRLLLFKKTKRLKLLRHYNYAYIGEYEFSPSNTPSLFHHYHRDSSALVKKKKRRHTRILSLLCCGGGTGDTAASAEAEALHDDAGRDTLFDEVLSEWGEEDDFSVDGRAERFIEKFYEEKRIERQESLLQYKEILLQKICSS